jgi:Tol biopolymer transport system component
VLNRIAFSPDGRRLAYVLDGHLWVRDLAKLDAIEIPGSDRADTPFFSPDGSQVGFRAGGTFYRVPASGGTPTVIAATQDNYSGGSAAWWSDDDRVLFTTGSRGILEVSANGGDPVEIVPRREYENDLHDVSALPGGRGLLFVPHNRSSGMDSLILWVDGERRPLLALPNQRIWTPRYSPTGHILYGRTPANSGVWALPFSLSSLRVTGEPFLVAVGAAEPWAASDGSLVFLGEASTYSSQLSWIKRDGSLETVLGEPAVVVGGQRLSPDVKRVAAVVDDGSGGDIWVYDLERGTQLHLTSDPNWDIQPCWSPDGKTIYYVSVSRASIMSLPADGTGQAIAIGAGFGPDVSGDGKWLVFDVDNTETQSIDLMAVPLPIDTTQSPRVIVSSRFDEGSGHISPSGNYLAYVSNESGENGVYITRFPVGEGKWQASVGAGSRPRWDPEGGRLYYTSEDALMELDVTERPELTLGKPRELFKLRDARVVVGRTSGFDVVAGGQRFLMSHNPQAVASQRIVRIVLVENWFSEFEKK